MKPYSKYSTTTTRNERFDMCLAVAMVAGFAAVGVDLFVRGVDSVFGVFFMWLVRMFG